MFLVDDDEPRASQRREHRRARADDDVGLAARRGQPGARALAFAQARVHHFDARGQAFAETAQRLRGQTDFGHEHERLPAARDDVFDQREIDLGLAAAGDALQQRRREAAELRGDVGDGRGLLLTQRRTGDRRARRRAQRELGRFGQAALAQIRCRAAPAGQLRVEFGVAARPGSEQVEQRGGARTGARKVFRRSAADPAQRALARGDRNRLGRAQADRQRGFEHLAERMLVIACRPGQRRRQLRRDPRRFVKHAQRTLQLARVDRAVVGAADHHADARLAGERHGQARAGRDGRGIDSGRRQIVETLRQRNRDG